MEHSETERVKRALSTNKEVEPLFWTFSISRTVMLLWR